MFHRYRCSEVELGFEVTEPRLLFYWSHRNFVGTTFFSINIRIFSCYSLITYLLLFLYSEVGSQ